MQIISLLLMIIGIMLITISYTKEKIRNMDKRIQYRYIPRTLYDEQIGSMDLSKTYEEIYMKSNPGKYGLDTKEEMITTENPDYISSINDENSGNIVDTEYGTISSEGGIII